MTVLIDSRQFDLAEPSAGGQIQAMLSPFLGAGGYTAEVRISAAKVMKRQKKLAWQILADFVRDGPKGVLCGEYEFFFDDHAYYWKRQKLHLTAGEELFLYRWLVLDRSTGSDRHFMENMRRRFGLGFLRLDFTKENKVIYV